MDNSSTTPSASSGSGNRILLGLTGKAGVGKDTVADYLVEKHGFVRMAFADPLKDAFYKRFGIPRHWDMNRGWREEGCPVFGYSEEPLAPVFHSARSWLQWLGTEFGREMFGEDCWVEKMQKRLDDCTAERVVITDVRFDNEANWLWYAGSFLVDISREAAPCVLSHRSEQGVSAHLPRWHLRNNSTLDALRDEVDIVVYEALAHV